MKIRLFHSRALRDSGNTLCGAEPTEYDVTRDEAARVLKPCANAFVRFEPCSDCRNIVEPQTRRRVARAS